MKKMYVVLIILSILLSTATYNTTAFAKSSNETPNEISNETSIDTGNTEASTEDPIEDPGILNLNPQTIYWQNKAAVLMYHQVEPSPYGAASISPELFASHMDMLINEGFNIISLDDMDLFMQKQFQVPPNALAITFDDGYQGVYQHAFPILKERKIPAAVFTIVSCVGQSTNQQAKLTWQEMREMAAHGVKSYSHSHNGHYYAQINMSGRTRPALTAPILKSDNSFETRDEYIRRIYIDLLKSKHPLEQNLGYPVKYFAAPYGWVTRDMINVANFAGYDYIFTTKPGLNDLATPANNLKRVNAGNPAISAEILLKKLQQLPKTS